MEKRVEILEKTITSLTDYIKFTNTNISNGFEKVNANFEKITKHLSQIDAELRIVNAKIDKLDGNTSTGLGEVHVKLDDLKTEITKINDVTGYDGIFSNMKIV